MRHFQSRRVELFKSSASFAASASRYRHAIFILVLAVIALLFYSDYNRTKIAMSSDVSSSDSLAILAHAICASSDHEFSDVLCYLRYRRFGSVSNYLNNKVHHPLRGLVPSVPLAQRRSIKAQWRIVIARFKKLPPAYFRCPEATGFDTISGKGVGAAFDDDSADTTCDDRRVYLSFYSRFGRCRFVDGFPVVFPSVSFSVADTAVSTNYDALSLIDIDHPSDNPLLFATLHENYPSHLSNGD